jgi:DNA-binding CsgD family transcriptional regulator
LARVPGQTDAITSALECLELAPFDSHQWVEALKAFRDATGSSITQLLTTDDSTRGIPTNVYSEQWEVEVEEWIGRGGSDPAVNPYIAAGARLDPYQSFTDWEVVDESERRRHPLVGDFYDKMDVPHICCFKLESFVPGRSHYLVALRSKKRGPIGREQRAIHGKVARAAGMAIRRTLAVRSEGARLLRGALDTLSIAAFAVDGFGRMVAASAAGERIVCEGQFLRVVRGRFQACDEAGTRAIEQAVLGSARRLPGSAPSPAEIFQLRGADGKVAAKAQVIPLPRERSDIGLGAVGLLVIDRRRQESFQFLVEQWGLTRAEADVAVDLSRGARAGDISRVRGVSRETVRSQIKSIYAKARVTSQPAFIARCGAHRDADP